MKNILYILFIIPLFSFAQSSGSFNSTNIGLNGSEGAVIYVDNVRINSKHLPHIKPAQIASITIVRPADAVKLYGPAAKNGAVIIETKGFAKKHLLHKVTNPALSQIDIGHRPEYLKGSTNVDSLNLWTYYFNLENELQNDSVKAIAFVYFRRSHPVIDSNYSKASHQSPTSGLGFYIYNLSDSAFCRKISSRTVVISSCLSPHVGGDYLVVGKFIFVNTDVCIGCAYCRPVIYTILNNVDASRANTLAEIFNQFPIKRAGK